MLNVSHPETPMQRMRSALFAGLLLAGPALAAPLSFVNGITVPGNTPDQFGDSVNDGRVGMFSDIYYDPTHGEWWGLSDRGPGGGTLSYDTRVQRFTIDINMNTGAISNFQIAQSVKFTDPNNVLGAGAGTMNGQAPSPSSILGRALDPEGFVVNPKTGTFLVSDEYGPSLYEFNRAGELLRQFTTPANLVPKVGATTNYTTLPPTLTAGREPNRGLEALAISPDGKYAYAVLQNGAIQDGWSPAGGGTRGQYTRIVKFETATGEAVAQYAYKLDSSGQGRGISALVALGDDRFMILERNNRGVGIGANVASPDKNVYLIDLTGASDVTGISLPATGNLPAGYTAVAKGEKVIDLDANTLAALGNKSPEKWEGLTVGPRLNNGNFVFVAGTDNDYSVTQNAGGTQFDVYLRPSDADPFASSIQCPLGQVTGCFFAANNAAAALTGEYALLPGVLHAYFAEATDPRFVDYVTPTPEPASLALVLAGAGSLGWFTRRRRSMR